MMTNKPVAGVLWGCCIQGRNHPTHKGGNRGQGQMSAAVGCHGCWQNRPPFSTLAGIAARRASSME